MLLKNVRRTGRKDTWGCVVFELHHASALGKCVLRAKVHLWSHLYSNRMWRCHQVPRELRLISQQWILMWHLAVVEYHLGNGRGVVLWPGIIHSAAGRRTASLPSLVGFTDKNLTLDSGPHYVIHLSQSFHGENFSLMANKGFYWKRSRNV